MGNPTAAMLVIGDEILSGRTRDSNMHHLAGELTKHGVDLKEVRVVSDERAAIVEAVRHLALYFDHVFTSGGIGPTHDDITAEAVAAAFGTTAPQRADALKLLGDHYAARGIEFTEARKRMARVPEGATMIENPVSVAPGFTLENVHVMAGVPSVFEAMVAGVLPTITGGAPLLSQSLRVMRGEGVVADPLGALAEEFSDLSFGSYPFQQDGAFGTNIVVRGQDAARVDAAMVRLVELFGT
ncbi:competence/damage-inducible protein A [Vannielia litorea]|uniref:competence/damage-inducible protein A n=1 Tax=Vannielia litorea TaxID=1217970 RepID=UPI001C98C5B5|nr:molybdopterin-binding protein [Vannielia litorea]MBY6049898.1 competence/damage-inducible protein A [Vannielia litorea]MBY6077312.1 competence/damage-inducible protein A [Vannielia litorea]MBY6155457.1 competence/damage-inducible protein A [Vannielia litorea]